MLEVVESFFSVASHHAFETFTAKVRCLEDGKIWILRFQHLQISCSSPK